MEKTIKLVWICHFTNAEMQSKLPLRKNRGEFASWIPNMLKGFENKEEIEVHVISPHEFLKRSTNLLIRNIHYHFIPFGIPFWRIHWPGKLRLDVFSNFYFFRRKVRKRINKIQPDIIDLIGAENAYYSSSIFDVKDKYPVLITIQGFISSMGGAIKLNSGLKKRIAVEENILKSFKYFCGEQDSSTYISKYNSNHVFFKLYYPVNEKLVLNTIDTEKTYDCIYFGKLSKMKGIEDFVRVIAEIKKQKPSVKACIVGGGDINPLRILSKELNCSENITYIGFVKTQKELFEYVSASKVFLVPPYFERLSLTIREAMFLKVPIVAYATGGIPYINEFDENIILVKTGDYKEMARRTLLLLEDETLRIGLSKKAFQYAVSEFGLSVNSERLLSAYNTIIKEFNRKKQNGIQNTAI